METEECVHAERMLACERVRGIMTVICVCAAGLVMATDDVVETDERLPPRPRIAISGSSRVIRRMSKMTDSCLRLELDVVFELCECVRLWEYIDGRMLPSPPRPVECNYSFGVGDQFFPLQSVF